MDSPGLQTLPECRYNKTTHHPQSKRFPITPDRRLSVPESEAGVLLQDLHNNRAPRLLLRRKGSKRTVSPGAAYLARPTLALLRDAIHLDTARLAWEHRHLPLICRPPAKVEIELDKMRGGGLLPKLSTTWDFMRGASTKRRYFWFGGLLALVPGV